MALVGSKCQEKLSKLFADLNIGIFSYSIWRWNRHCAAFGTTIRRDAQVVAALGATARQYLPTPANDCNHPNCGQDGGYHHWGPILNVDPSRENKPAYVWRGADSDPFDLDTNPGQVPHAILMGKRYPVGRPWNVLQGLPQSHPLWSYGTAAARRHNRRWHVSHVPNMAIL